MNAQPLDVGDQVTKRVVVGLAGRCRASGAALVENYDAVDRGIEETAMRRRRTGTRAAVQKPRRQAGGIARLFPVHGVVTVERQHAVLVRLDRREQVLAADSRVVGHGLSVRIQAAKARYGKASLTIFPLNSR